MKGVDFGSFLLELIHNNKEIKENLRDYVFYMDNASIHKAKKLKGLYSKINVLFAPPYSPFLNPIEEVFCWVKHYVRKLKFNDREKLIKNLHMALQQMDAKKI